MWNYHFWLKNDGEKWSRKNYFEIPRALLNSYRIWRPGRKTSGFRTVHILEIFRTSGPEERSGRALLKTSSKIWNSLSDPEDRLIMMKQSYYQSVKISKKFLKKLNVTSEIFSPLKLYSIFAYSSQKILLSQLIVINIWHFQTKYCLIDLQMTTNYLE